MYLYVVTLVYVVYSCDLLCVAVFVLALSCVMPDVNNCVNENYCVEVRNIPNSACVNVLATGIEGCPCHVGFGPEGACGNLDECSLGTHNCSALGGNCTDTFGSFQCACLAGFSGNGFNCVDIDECVLSSPCDTNATCNNTIGSFTCTCAMGFSGDGVQCIGKKAYKQGRVITSSRLYNREV